MYDYLEVIEDTRISWESCIFHFWQDDYYDYPDYEDDYYYYEDEEPLPAGPTQ